MLIALYTQYTPYNTYILQFFTVKVGVFCLCRHIQKQVRGEQLIGS